jgi:hypothetical protein
VNQETLSFRLGGHSSKVSVSVMRYITNQEEREQTHGYEPLSPRHGIQELYTSGPTARAAVMGLR